MRCVLACLCVEADAMRSGWSGPHRRGAVDVRVVGGWVRARLQLFLKHDFSKWSHSVGIDSRKTRTHAHATNTRARAYARRTRAYYAHTTRALVAQTRPAIHTHTRARAHTHTHTALTHTHARNARTRAHTRTLTSRLLHKPVFRGPAVSAQGMLLRRYYIIIGDKEMRSRQGIALLVAAPFSGEWLPSQPRRHGNGRQRTGGASSTTAAATSSFQDTPRLVPRVGQPYSQRAPDAAATFTALALAAATFDVILHAHHGREPAASTWAGGGLGVGWGKSPCAACAKRAECVAAWRRSRA